jgi:hypothetical protein
MRFGYEDNGNCRVVFFRIVEGKRYTYCWQEEAAGEFKFYRCSTGQGYDEPDYSVLGFGGVPARELTPLNPGETETGVALNTFLKKNACVAGAVQ